MAAPEAAGLVPVVATVVVVVVGVVAAAVDPAAGAKPGSNSRTVLERVEVDVATVDGRRLDRQRDRKRKRDPPLEVGYAVPA